MDLPLFDELRAEEPAEEAPVEDFSPPPEAREPPIPFQPAAQVYDPLQPVPDPEPVELKQASLFELDAAYGSYGVVSEGKKRTGKGRAATESLSTAF